LIGRRLTSVRYLTEVAAGMTYTAGSPAGVNMNPVNKAAAITAAQTAIEAMIATLTDSDLFNAGEIIASACNNPQLVANYRTTALAYASAINS
jgi:hypothetical protein